MEFKKCLRCGSFFMSDNNVCCNCEPKDRLDISKLNSFISNNAEIDSIQSLSINTGVSINNLDRFMQNNDIDSFNV